jgi:hypothetical protein
MSIFEWFSPKEPTIFMNNGKGARLKLTCADFAQDCLATASQSARIQTFEIVMCGEVRKEPDLIMKIAKSPDIFHSFYFIFFLTVYFQYLVVKSGFNPKFMEIVGNHLNSKIATQTFDQNGLDLKRLRMILNKTQTQNLLKKYVDIFIEIALDSRSKKLEILPTAVFGTWRIFASDVFELYSDIALTHEDFLTAESKFECSKFKAVSHETIILDGRRVEVAASPQRISICDHVHPYAAEARQIEPEQLFFVSTCEYAMNQLTHYDKIDLISFE